MRFFTERAREIIEGNGYGKFFREGGTGNFSGRRVREIFQGAYGIFFRMVGTTGSSGRRLRKIFSWRWEEPSNGVSFEVPRETICRCRADIPWRPDIAADCSGRTSVLNDTCRRKPFDASRKPLVWSNGFRRTVTGVHTDAYRYSTCGGGCEVMDTYSRDTQNSKGRRVITDVR